jgi:soluble lytic murein transglycosylase-like protein
MESRTPSARKRAWRRAAITLLLPVVFSCRAAPGPTLAQALAVRGAAGTRAKAFMNVAVRGRISERARAAMLWGLYACDAHAPVGALTGFNLARPQAGLAHLATRRLEEALEASRSTAAAWRAAVAAPWLSAEDRVWLRLRGAEVLASRGGTASATGLLPDLSTLRREDLGRALAVIASSPDREGASARRRVVVEFPLVFAGAFPGQGLDRVEATFTRGEWAVNALAWLDAGRPEAALRAATHAGGEAFLVAAQAALRLHRAGGALSWAARGGERCAECWLERAEGFRQIAWGSPLGKRGNTFGEMLRAAQRGRALLPPGSALEGRAEILVGEPLVELGRFAEALPHLTVGAVQTQPRWEWVCRRLVFLKARQKPPTSGLPSELGKSTRGRRLAEYWRGRIQARRGDRAGLEALATSGFPDLAAQWATEELGRVGVAVRTSEERSPATPPPAWAADLLAAGRVADVVLGWRTDLEAAGANGPGWLGLLALADMPALEAIPLLMRGEPRLLSGPWQGVPRALLERYLPLPLRPELEGVAKRRGVPPWLLAGLVRQESAWNQRARSAAGALGLAQVLPGSANEMAKEIPGLSPRGDLFDPTRNLTLGAALLLHWRRAFGGSWVAALAAYNSGENRVREVWEASGRRDGPDFVEALEIPETWDYVHRVVLLSEGYRILYWPEGRAYPWT